MKNFFKYDYEVSKKRIIRSAIIFVIVMIYGVTSGFLKKQPLLTGLEAVIISGFFIGGFPYGWSVAREALKPRGYNEATGEEYFIGGANGVIMQVVVGFASGLILGGILFAIDLIRTIAFIVSKRIE